MTAAHTTESIRSGSRIRLFDLRSRQDGEEWIVGRFETRDFVALPVEGVRALELLSAGHTVGDVTERMVDASGREFDVLSFVRQLVDMGFVAEVDGIPVLCERPAPPSFAGVRPWRLRFALSPVLPKVFGCLMLAAALVLILRPDLLPSRHNLLWSPEGSGVLALSFVAGWSLVFVHELAHFAVARATGVHARIRLGTRLQFLVAETDMSGIELAPRRYRLTAYLAGMATNLAVAAVAILLGALTDEGTLAHRILAAIIVIALLPLAFQFMIFMRTDVYFVLQDLTRCRNLYGDGLAYARYLGNRLWHRVSGREYAGDDPSLGLPGHERRAVRVYSVALVAGTVLCLIVMATVTLPTDLALIARALGRLGPGQSAAANLDSFVVLLILGTAHTVWFVTWRRRRRAKRRGYGSPF